MPAYKMLHYEFIFTHVTGDTNCKVRLPANHLTCFLGSTQMGSDRGGGGQHMEASLTEGTPEHTFPGFTDYDKDFGRKMQCIRKLED